MPHYLITWDESDGNDCRIYDTVVEAESEEQAIGKLANAIETRLTENKVDFEQDGSELGYYFNCPELSQEDLDLCSGHGGISLRDVKAFETEKDAWEDHPFYHSVWSI